MGEIVEHPQVRSHHMLTQVQNSKGSTLTVAGNPLLAGRSAPLLDADRGRILTELGVGGSGA